MIERLSLYTDFKSISEHWQWPCRTFAVYSLRTQVTDSEITWTTSIIVFKFFIFHQSDFL